MELTIDTFNNSDEAGWRARLIACAGACAVAAGVLLGWPSAGDAAVNNDPFEGLQPMSEAELASRRGGLAVAVAKGPFNTMISLGGNVRTMINGELVLETLITFGRRGTNVVHTVPNLAGLPPGLQNLEFLGDPDDLVVAGGGSGPTVVTSDGSDLVAAGTTISLPGGFEGVILPGENGATLALQRIAPQEGQVANLVINTEPGVSVTQDLNLEIEISGFANIRAASRENAIRSRVREAIRASSLGALGN